MRNSANGSFCNSGEKNRERYRISKYGKLVDKVQIAPGEMMDNVKRINKTLTTLKVPHNIGSKSNRPWGLSDTISYIVELGAPYIIQSAEYQRLEREAETISRADKQDGAILDAIMDKQGL